MMSAAMTEIEALALSAAIEASIAYLVMLLALKGVQIKQIDATGLHCAPPG